MINVSYLVVMRSCQFLESAMVLYVPIVEFHRILFAVNMSYYVEYQSRFDYCYVQYIQLYNFVISLQ